MPRPNLVETTGVIKMVRRIEGYGSSFPLWLAGTFRRDVTVLRRDGYQTADEGARWSSNATAPEGYQVFRIVSMDESP